MTLAPWFFIWAPVIDVCALAIAIPAFAIAHGYRRQRMTQ